MLKNIEIILDKNTLKKNVSDILKENTDTKKMVEEKLNEVLKANLLTQLLGKPDSKLGKLIEKLPASKIDDIKELSLKKYVQQKIESKLGDDNALREEYDDFIAGLNDQTKITDFLGLDKRLEENPFFTDVVSNSIVYEIVKVTELKNKADEFLQQFIKFGHSTKNFWEKLIKKNFAAREDIIKSKLAFEFAAISLNNISLIKVFVEENHNSLKDLVSRKRDDWLKIFQSNRINPPDSFGGENRKEKEAYADHLLEAITKLYPTDVFFDRFNSDDIDNYEKDFKKIKTVLEANPSFKIGQNIKRNANWPTNNQSERKQIRQSLARIASLMKVYSKLGLEDTINNPGLAANNKLKAIKQEREKVYKVFKNNPDLDLQLADFFKGYYTRPSSNGDPKPVIKWNGIEEKDRHQIIAQLKTYQRLFRLHPRYEISKRFMQEGLDAAQKIALLTEKQFMDKYLPKFGNDKEFIKNIYRKALGIKEKAWLEWANVKDLVVSRAYQKTRFNNTDPEVIDYYSNMRRSYQDLFGSLYFCECEHCKSIFSPAAYFVDLMRLINQYIIEDQNLNNELRLYIRRRDLWNIPLDCEHTNTLIPYIDIVNEILENNVGANPYRRLSSAVHPFNLPFNLPLVQIRLFLGHFNKGLWEIFETFQQPAVMIAREFLNISSEEANILATVSTNLNDLKVSYGMDDGRPFRSGDREYGGLSIVPVFLHHTGLTRKELNELIYQNLSDNEINAQLQKDFFINVGQANAIELEVVNNDSGGAIKWYEIEEIEEDVQYQKLNYISRAKLDRIHRFIRLAKKLEWSFTDLDWALKSINSPPNGTIDDDVLIKLAKIKKWQLKHKLPLDVLCSFWHSIKHIGKIDDDNQKDLFNRVFNNPDLEGATIDINNPAEWNPDDPDDPNRGRLLAALQISDNDLVEIIRILEDFDSANSNYIFEANDNLKLTHVNITRLYRYAKIPQVLKIRINEYCLLLELLFEDKNNREIRTIDDFERLSEIVDWLKDAELNILSLHSILESDPSEFIAPGIPDSDIRILTDDISKAVLSAILKPESFLEIVDEFQSEKIIEELVNNNTLENVEKGYRLKIDPNIVNLDLGLSAELAPYNDQIVNILKQYDERQIILVQLSLFFGLDPTTLQSVINFAAPTPDLNDANLRKLLSTPIADGAVPDDNIFNFLRPVQKYAVLFKLLKLKKSEIDDIKSNPEHYGIVDPTDLKIQDIKNIHLFKELTNAFYDVNDEIIDLFTSGNRSKLAELGRWDKEHLDTLITEFESNNIIDFNNLDVIGLQKLKNALDLAKYLGTSVEIILNKWIANLINPDWAKYIVTANSVLEIFNAKYGEDQWEDKFEPVNDIIRNHKRDALTSYVIWNIDKNWPYDGSIPRIRNLRDLYEYLLIDVEMSPCATISRIKEGLLALQLYIYRCRMNLEPGITFDSVTEKQWSWMKNYRVWEANRKVFLYPENYIYPELRDNKTPIFKELEDELLQVDITDITAEQVYRNYLNKFSELANLKTAGSYLNKEIDDNGNEIKVLYLIGRSNTEPYKFYLRKYINETTWTPWERIDLNIKSKYISPIFSFGRLFLFWAEITEATESKIEDGKSSSHKYHKVEIKFSFYDFNSDWTQPQLLTDFTTDLYTYDLTLTRGGELTTGVYYELKSRIYPMNYMTMTNIGFSKYIELPLELGINQITLLNNLTIGRMGPMHPEGCVQSRLHLQNFNLYKQLFFIDAYHLYTSNFFAAISKLLIYGAYGTDSSSYNLDSASIILDLLHESSSMQIVNQNDLNNRVLSNDRYILDNINQEFLIQFDIEIEPFYVLIGKFLRTSTNAVHELIDKLFAGGLDYLLTIESQKAAEPEFPPNNLSSNSYLPSSTLDFEGAYGTYYKEIFFHIPFLIASQLNSNQKFEEALKWYHYIYNPTVSEPEPNVADDDLQWRFLPFRNVTLESICEMLNNQQSIAAYHNDPFNPHAIARLRKNAYQKTIVMKYIDNLLDWGDYCFAKDSWESLQEATMYYIMAYNLLGERPEKLEVCRQTDEINNYNDIETKYTTGDIPEFLIGLENSTCASQTNEADTSIYESLFFCIPENDLFLKYWDRVEEKLNNIRYCLNIAGIKRELSLYEPEIDPMALVRAVAGSRDLGSVLTEISRPLPHYRFSYMIEKAKNLASTAQQLGSTFLSALEKQDVEEISQLRTIHEQNIQQLTSIIKENQLQEAIESHNALIKSKNNAQTRNTHYTTLIEKGLSRYEERHLTSMRTAWSFEQISSIYHLYGSIMHLIPNVGAPTAMTFGGRELGNCYRALGDFFRMFASYHSHGASMSSILGSQHRRKQDWELQEKLSKHDIEQIEYQINAAEIRKIITDKEIEIHKKNIKQTQEIYDFMHEKFTNKELYQWICNQLSGLYYQTYKLAYDYAKSAEKAFQNELNSNDTYINFGHWDSLKKGLVAGDKLMLELNQLEKAYLEGNSRAFEIEKTISLIQLEPLVNKEHGTAFHELKENGVCEFEFTESLFDFDFPGHYCRKIKSISISIPAIIGPNENINATLTQLSSKTILKPNNNAVNYLLKVAGATEPDNSILRREWRMSEQIAISRGINDNGMFELNFRDERYLPFEDSGAISSWRLDLPKENNRINFNSISEVIIKLRYTALQGGEAFKNNVVNNLPKQSGFKIISLRHEFSSDWHLFMNPPAKQPEHEFKFEITEAMLPVNNVSNYNVNKVFLKLDVQSVTLSTGSDAFKIPLKPGSANEVTFTFDGTDIDGQDISGGNPFGEWVIKVNRGTGIPIELRKKESGVFFTEDIDGKDHYYLNPEELKNIGLILVFEEQ